MHNPACSTDNSFLFRKQICIFYFLKIVDFCDLLNQLLTPNVASGNDITTCIKVDKSLVNLNRSRTNILQNLDVLPPKTRAFMYMLF